MAGFIVYVRSSGLTFSPVTTLARFGRATNINDDLFTVQYAGPVSELAEAIKRDFGEQVTFAIAKVDKEAIAYGGGAAVSIAMGLLSA